MRLGWMIPLGRDGETERRRDEGGGRDGETERRRDEVEESPPRTSSLCLSVSSSLSGFATQNTSVFATGRAPSPVPSTSRITPPTPVAAPPYGSMALG